MVSLVASLAHRLGLSRYPGFSNGLLKAGLPRLLGSVFLNRSRYTYGLVRSQVVVVHGL